MYEQESTIRLGTCFTGNIRSKNTNCEVLYYRLLLSFPPVIEIKDCYADYVNEQYMQRTIQIHIPKSIRDKATITSIKVMYQRRLHIRP